MMRIVSFLLVWLLEGHPSSSQEKVLSSEAMLKDALRTHMVDGHVDKYFKRTGDAGAVMLARILGEATPSDAEIDDILTFVGDAFSDLRSVEISSDREPRVTLLMLRYLDSVTHAPALRSRIADTRKFVLSAYANLAEGHQER